MRFRLCHFVGLVARVIVSVFYYRLVNVPNRDWRPTISMCFRLCHFVIMFALLCLCMSLMETDLDFQRCHFGDSPEHFLLLLCVFYCRPLLIVFYCRPLLINIIFLFLPDCYILMQLNEEVLGKDDCRHDEYVWGDDKTVTQWENIMICT